MEVRVARIDPCPKPSKIVGFTILHKPTGKSLYLDAFIPIDECPETTTDQEVVDKAWQRIKPNAMHWSTEMDKKESSLIGTVIDI
jgi:hypothetical protein